MPGLDYWTAQLLSLVAGGIITAGTMYLAGFRRVHRGAETRLVPEIDRTPLRQRFGCVLEHYQRLRAWLGRVDRQSAVTTTLVVVMAAAVIYGQIQANLFNAHQRECNVEFRSSSLELRKIGNEDRALENQDDGLRNQRDDMESALLEALATPPPPIGQRVDERALLAEFNRAVAGLDVQRDRLYAERAALEERRRAQPTPEERC
ncbi:hypothetical protein ACTD5D_31880 [Nocardia takedensis]|uniref:hypothetical protein n=1 Tax=Nocardia takedensis TaxID=259390 RepID=UPI003F774AC6